MGGVTLCDYVCTLLLFCCVSVVPLSDYFQMLSQACLFRLAPLVFIRRLSRRGTLHLTSFLLFVAILARAFERVPFLYANVKLKPLLPVVIISLVSTAKRFPYCIAQETI